MTHTTCVATRLNAGHANNALPQLAQANVNCGILPGHSLEEVEQTLIKTFNDPAVVVRYVDDAGNVLDKIPDRKAFPPVMPPPEILRSLERVTDSLWPGAPSRMGKTRIGGVNINQPRMRKVLDAMLSLACSPAGFTVSDPAAQVRVNLPAATTYDARRAAYDLKKLRGKDLINRVGKSRRYTVPPQALRAIAALVLLREKVIRPILAGIAQPKMGRKPKNWSPIGTPRWFSFALTGFQDAKT